MPSSSSEARVGGCHSHALRPPCRAELPGLSTLAGKLPPPNIDEGGKFLVGTARADTKESHNSACCEALLRPKFLPQSRPVATKQPGLGNGPVGCARPPRLWLAVFNFPTLTNMSATPRLKLITASSGPARDCMEASRFPEKTPLPSVCIHPPLPVHTFP